jgi:hypothetical protein
MPEPYEGDFVHPELAAALIEARADPTGERLKRYWTEGEGAAKIRWGTPGDFMRCVHHLEKYIADPKGYCSDMHQRATGFRPGHAPTEQRASAPMAEIKDVEIARVGEWNLKSGKLNVTPEMLVDAAAYANRPGAQAGYIKLGHGDPRFDGEPSLGWIQNVRVEGSGADSVLLGDIVDMPAWLAEAAPKHWPNRSMEGWTDYQDGDRVYAMVVDGLSLLGVTPPGMSSLRSLRDLPQALGVAASARIVATIPDPTPPPAEPAPQLPTASAGGPIKTEGGSAVAFSDEQITNLRAKLQLPDTADEAAILAAVGAVVDESLEERPPGAEAPAAPVATTATPPAPVDTAPIAAGPGTMVIDASAWEAREEDIKRLKAAEAKRRTEERDQVIGQAIQAGKFPPARREHWTRLWDADSEGARQVIAGLTPNVVPVDSMGELGSGEDSIDEEYAHLFPPTPKGV